MSFLQIILITLGVSFMLTTHAYADTTNCQTIYGGGQNCQQTTLVLQKLVLNPQTGTYVHDLGLVDNKFMPGDKVTFELTVTNTGTATADDVIILDTLPAHMRYASATISNNGAPDLDFNIGNLLPGQTTSMFLTVQLDSADQLGNTGSICLINRARAHAEQDDTFVYDSSQMCIFHPETFTPPSVISTPITPGTGPSIYSYMLLPSAAVVGILLKRTTLLKKGKQN